MRQISREEISLFDLSPSNEPSGRRWGGLVHCIKPEKCSCPWLIRSVDRLKKSCRALNPDSTRFIECVALCALVSVADVSAGSRRDAHGSVVLASMSVIRSSWTLR